MSNKQTDGSERNLISIKDIFDEGCIMGLIVYVGIFIVFMICFIIIIGLKILNGTL